MIISAVLALALVNLQPSYRARFPMPDETVPSGLGVNIHFTEAPEREVRMIADAGFRWVRMDFAWNSIEREKGSYDFSHYDDLMASLSRHGIRPMFILDYGNDLYEQGAPRTAASRDAFCRFVAASVRHFEGRGIIWEMWNEPNGGFWKPRADVSQYIALAQQVGDTIRSTASQEYYVGPATSGFDWQFLKACFDSGLLDLFDAVTVHPYRDTAPDTVSADWLQLRALIAGHSNRRLPMYAGEWGYSEKYRGLDAERQGWYIAREYLSDLAAGVPLTIYYDWKDDGSSPTDPEHHFGTVYQDLKPKPAYLAIRHLVQKLRGFRCESVVQLPDRREHLLTFRKGSE